VKTTDGFGRNKRTRASASAEEGTMTMGEMQREGVKAERAIASDGKPGSIESQEAQISARGNPLKPESGRIVDIWCDRVVKAGADANNSDRRGGGTGGMTKAG
jgi:hypothetical protein